jgi:hypothetical protein
MTAKHPMRPSTLVIMGKTYAVTYHAKSCDVDPDGASSMFGHTDVREKSIRIHDCADPVERFDSLLHEVLHVVSWEMRGVLDLDENHHDLARLAATLADTLIRNGMVTP